MERKRGVGLVGLGQLLGSGPGVDSRLAADLSWLHFLAKTMGINKIPLQGSVRATVRLKTVCVDVS